MARTVRGSKKIATKRWVGVAADSGNMSAGSVAVNVRAAESFPDTVLRNRGELVVLLDGVQAPGILVRWGFGLICVPQGQATTVIWGPLTDPEAPWFVYASGFLGYWESVIDVIQSTGVVSSARYAIDSKSMRKCPPDLELQAIFENETVVGASNIRVNYHGRMLLGR